MKGLARILSLLVAAATMLSASGWSSGAAACQIPPGMEMVSGGSAAAPTIRQPAHHPQQPHRRPARSDPAQGPADPRLDCAACVGVLPSFPSIAPRVLMPFMAEADAFEPLSGIEPVVDPPPPRD